MSNAVREAIEADENASIVELEEAVKKFTSLSPIILQWSRFSQASIRRRLIEDISGLDEMATSRVFASRVDAKISHLEKMCDAYKDDEKMVSFITFELDAMRDVFSRIDRHVKELLDLPPKQKTGTKKRDGKI